MRMDLRVDDSGDPVAQLRMLRNLQRAYDEGDYETLAVFAPEGARDLYAALAASRRGDRQAARAALEAMRAGPAGPHGSPRWPGTRGSVGVSRLLGERAHRGGGEGGGLGRTLDGPRSWQTLAGRGHGRTRIRRSP